MILGGQEVGRKRCALAHFHLFALWVLLLNVSLSEEIQQDTCVTLFAAELPEGNFSLKHQREGFSGELLAEMKYKINNHVFIPVQTPETKDYCVFLSVE